MVTELVNKYEIPYEVRRTLKGLTNNDEDCDKVQEMLDIGLKQGGEGLELLSRKELKKLEPHLDAAWAILCPRTLTLDPHALMRCFVAQAMERGTHVVYKSKVIEIEKVTDGYKVTLRNGDERFSFTTRLLINCAGLNSEKMAQLVGIDTAKAGYQVHFHRAGEYTVDRAKTALLNSGIDTIALLKGPHIGYNLDGIIRIGLHIKYVDSWDSIDYEYGRLCAWIPKTNSAFTIR